MRAVMIVVALSLVTAGCSRLSNPLGGDEPVSFEGIRFNAKLSADTEARRNYTVSVTPFAVNPEAALEAGRYEAVKYCLRRYGGSDAAWTVGPDSDPAGFQPVDDTIVLSGRCTQS